ncbi:hypothetical protein JTE90_016964 [Oedothorax gibbosus]|uniref:Uncharacterized protein n=1 Tax=Oedothorax gibbosus TaxID=931172 RepID=A0AAV6UHQ3_9ARAC|nr:hypothetical protein JTE90_016964 [Oedothorax gibbosus]
MVFTSLYIQCSLVPFGRITNQQWTLYNFLRKTHTCAAYLPHLTSYPNLPQQNHKGATSPHPITRPADQTILVMSATPLDRLLKDCDGREARNGKRHLSGKGVFRTAVKAGHLADDSWEKA